jgi:cobalt-zinc-cadmium efflux system outer membrane protein
MLGLAPTVALAQEAPAPARATREAPSSPEVPRQLTLDDALRIFRSRGFDLLLADAAVKSAEGDQIAAGAVPNPSLSGGVSILPGYTAPSDCGGCQGLGFTVGLSDSAALIGDTLAGKRSARVSVARAALAAAKMQRADASRVLEFEVKQQYVTVGLAKTTLDFARDVAESSQKTLDKARQRYGGQARVIDDAELARVETAKYAADNALDRAGQALRQAQLDLGFLLGVRGNVPEFEVSAEFAKFAVPPRLASISADGLRREAYDHRPDLKALAYQKERASNSIELAKRNRFPDIALQAQYSQVGVSSTAVQPPTLFFGISTPLPLFYQQQGEIRRAEADYMTQFVARTKLEAQVVSDVEGAYNNYVTTRRLMERYEGQFLERARVARDITRTKYELGNAPLMDFLDAQRTFIATNLDYLQTLTNYWTAVFQLEQAVGMELRR